MRKRPHNAKLPTRLAIWASAVAVLLAVTAAAATAASAQQTGASLSLSLATSQSNIGPFVTTQAASATVDQNNGVRIDAASIAFGAIDVAVAHEVSYTVTLVPQSDLVGAIDPSTGSAMLSGQFTMTWQQDGASTPACAVGPFTVNVSTAAFGSSPYASSSGSMTLLDGAPSVPAAQGCGDSDVVNGYVPLPVAPANAPADTVPNPAWTLQATLSPPPTLSTPTTTTTTTSPPSTTTTGTVSPTTPNTAGGTTATPPPPAGPAPLRFSRPPGHPRTRVKTRTTPPTTGAHAQAPAPIDPSLLPIPPSPSSSTDAAGRLNSPNPNAIDPVPAGAKDPSSLAFLIGVFVVVIAAVALALPLIGRDIRRLLPGRSRERLGGPITLPPTGRGANGPAGR